MAPFYQGEGEVSQMLRRRHMVWIEALIEQ
jgi:hypothetical protein